MRINLEILKGDPNSVIYQDFYPWLCSTADLYARFLNEYEETRPMHDHEQAAVSLLLAGAAARGHLTAAENSIYKIDGTAGRLDLWIDIKDRQYWFEFKKFHADPRRYPKAMEMRIFEAISQIKFFEFDSKEYSVAGLIATNFDRKSNRSEDYKAFSNNPLVTLACRFGPDDFDGAFLYFHQVARGTCS